MLCAGKALLAVGLPQAIIYEDVWIVPKFRVPFWYPKILGAVIEFIAKRDPEGRELPIYCSFGNACGIPTLVWGRVLLREMCWLDVQHPASLFRGCAAGTILVLAPRNLLALNPRPTPEVLNPKALHHTLSCVGLWDT